MSYSAADVDRVLADLEVPHPWDLEGEPYTFENTEDAWHHFKCYEVDGVPSPLGRISHVAEYGGEGQGDQYWVVISITDAIGGTRYFRRDGWYASYSGGELDGETHEVYPAQKTVTVYE